MISWCWRFYVLAKLLQILPLPAESQICSEDILADYYDTGIYFSQQKIWEVHNIHLNKKTLTRSSITHIQKHPPELFYKSRS